MQAPCIGIMLPGRIPQSSVDIWLRAEPVSCNEAAKSAWRLIEPNDITPWLCRLAMADGFFLDSLATVSMSVAAPKGMVLSEGHQRASHSVSYKPGTAQSELIPGKSGCH
jgi:hypothetical protein